MTLGQNKGIENINNFKCSNNGRGSFKTGTRSKYEVSQIIPPEGEEVQNQCLTRYASKNYSDWAISMKNKVVGHFLKNSEQIMSESMMKAVVWF